MTLDDLKSWWKHYSPIMREAKKRNNLSLLKNNVNVYRIMIEQCRESITNEDDLKKLKLIERALNELLLDVSLEREKGDDQTRTREVVEEHIGNERTREDPKPEGFVERIRERYGGRREEGGVSEEDTGAGVVFENTLESLGEVRRHQKNSVHHSEDYFDAPKKNAPIAKNDLDTLESDAPFEKAKTHLLEEFRKHLETRPASGYFFDAH